VTYGTFTLRESGRAIVIAVEGEVDIANVGDLIAVLDRAFAQGTAPLIVSLGGARYFDSSTIHVFAQLLTRAEVTRRSVAFVIPPGSAAEAILNAAGLASALNVYPSDEAALAASPA
jgi:anti-anti-sigma factor